MPITIFTDTEASLELSGTAVSVPTSPSLPHELVEIVAGGVLSARPGRSTVNEVRMPARHGTFVRTSIESDVGSRQLATASTPTNAADAARTAHPARRLMDANLSDARVLRFPE